MDDMLEKPIVFWALNHRLEKNEIIYQLEEMASHGVGGAILHPRSGLLTPYLSDTYFDMIDLAIKEAERIGIDIWLYDEDPYPSGIAGGKVVAEHPEYRAQTMQYIRKQYEGGQNVKIDFPLNKIVGAYAVQSQENKITEVIDLSSKIGILRTEWRKERKYCTYYPTTYTKAKPQNRADTFAPYYSLEWTTPSNGQWTILIFYTEFIKDFWVYPSYVDQLNPNAIKYFIETTYDAYKNRFSNYFGNVVKGFFVDEPKYISDPYPWTNELPGIFEEEHGYPFYKALIALLIDSETSEKIRCDYWGTVEKQFLRTFPKQIKKWCDENNLKLIGHCSPEEEPVDQVRYTGSISYFMRSMSIPGTDFITNQVGGNKYPILPLSPIITASTARQFGNGKALCESFGVSEWQLKHGDIIKMANWLYSHGINTFIFHVFMYSMDGYRKMDAGPSEFYQSPSWKYFQFLSEYMQRVSHFFDTHKSLIDTAFYYPFKNWMALFGVHHNRALQIRDEFTALMNEFICNHWQFDFVDDRDFEDATVCGNEFSVGNAKYNKIIIPPLHYLSEESKKKLIECSNAGIKLLVFSHEDDFHYNMSELDVSIFDLHSNGEHGYSIEMPDNFNKTITLKGEYNRDIVLYYTGGNSYWMYNPLQKDVKIGYDICVPCNCVDVWYPSNNSHYYTKESGSVLIPEGTAVVLTATDTVKEVSEERFLSKKVIREFPAEWNFKTEKRNLLRLDDWILERKNEYGINFLDFEKQLNVAHSGEIGNYLDQFVPDTYWYKTVVDIDDYPGELLMIREKSAISGNWNIYVNGVLVDNWKNSHEFDCMESTADISQYRISKDNRLYQRGEFEITVEVNAKNAHEGLLEPIYIAGNFTVELNNAESIGAELHETTDEKIVLGSWTDQGYPYYCGAATYSQNFYYFGKQKNKRYLVTAYAAGNPIEVSLNTQLIGVINSPPYEIDVTEALMEGQNTISITTVNTSENMLYNLHSPSGLTKPVALIEMDMCNE